MSLSKLEPMTEDELFYYRHVKHWQMSKEFIGIGVLNIGDLLKTLSILGEVEMSAFNFDVKSNLFSPKEGKITCSLAYQELVQALIEHGKGLPLSERENVLYNKVRSNEDGHYSGYLVHEYLITNFIQLR